MENKDLTIHQPTNLTTARYDYSAIQKNLLYHILGHIQEHIEYPDRMQKNLFEDLEITLPLRLIEKNKNYADIINEAKELRKKGLEYSYINPKGKKVWVFTVPLHTIIHEKGSKNLTIVIPKDVVPVFAYLGAGFTQYQLITALALKSKYSKRLYELCCKWIDKGGFSVPITEFRKMMSIESKFPIIPNLRKFVLDSSCKELQEKADIAFEYNFSISASKKKAQAGRPSFDTIHFKVFSTKAKTKGLAQNLSPAFLQHLQEENEWLLAFFTKWVASKKLEAADICKRLMDEKKILKAHRRFLRLHQEFEDRKRLSTDMQTLTAFILTEDYGISI